MRLVGAQGGHCIDDGYSGMADDSQAQHGPPSSALRSAFAVLRALGRIQRHPVGVTQLALETGIPKTTVHRLLEQLADEKVVLRDRGKWTFGSGLAELHLLHSDLVDTARPRLRTMSLAAGASIFLYDGAGNRLTAVSREYGSRLANILRPAEQRQVAEGPGSSAAEALRSGQMAVD
jgi:DNA-binding IclR family transcriptional regulator